MIIDSRKSGGSREGARSDQFVPEFLRDERPEQLVVASGRAQVLRKAADRAPTKPRLAPGGERPLAVDEIREFRLGLQRPKRGRLMLILLHGLKRRGRPA